MNNKKEIKSKSYRYGVDQQFPKKAAAEQFITDSLEYIVNECLNNTSYVQDGDVYIQDKDSALCVVIPVSM